jgi:uncharacterized membrane protein
VTDWTYLLVMLAYNLGLAFWIGGGLALGAIAAPTLFRTLESRQTAGELFGRMLRRYSRGRVAAFALIVLAAALKTNLWESSFAGWWLLARWTTLVVMGGLMLLEILYLERAIDRLRAAGQASMADSRFARLHRLSEAALKGSLLAAVAALLLG